MNKNDYDNQAAEIIKSGFYNQAVELMDDEIRESLHAALSPCTDKEFLIAYMIEHYKKYNTDFTIWLKPARAFFTC